MSKKKRKEKKQKPEMIMSPWTDKSMLQMMNQFEEPTLHVKLAHEGKLYEGNIPCVGDDKV